MGLDDPPFYRNHALCAQFALLLPPRPVPTIRHAPISIPIRLPVVTTNRSNNYGPFQHGEKFIPTVIRSCLLQKPIPVYGTAATSATGCMSRIIAGALMQ